MKGRTVSWAIDLAQLVGNLPSVQEALGLILRSV